MRLLHEQASALIPQWAEQVAKGNPKVVGFSSTFQQNIASLALAKELRKRYSKEDMVIIFGGANAEGDMGKALSRSFDFLDHVVGGEAENIIPGLLKLMGKGTNVLQNIQILKWCKEYRISVSWNLIFGFPEEQQDEYDKMATLVPFLSHLPAPSGFGAIHQQADQTI